MIDGATPFGAFRSVVVPLLGPATLFLVVWSTINALQLFDEIYFADPGRPAPLDQRARLLRLPARVPVGRRGLRGRRSPTCCSSPSSSSRASSCGRPADGALLVMSAVDARPPARAAVAPAACRFRSALASGPRPARARDAGAARVDGRDVTRDAEETRHFPPVMIPPGIHWQNYQTALRGTVGAVVHEHDDRHRGVGGRQPRCSAASPATRSPACASSAGTSPSS